MFIKNGQIYTALSIKSTFLNWLIKDGETYLVTFISPPVLYTEMRFQGIVTEWLK